MPFKSEKQRRYLYANQPKLAKKWSNMYGKKITGLGGVGKKPSIKVKIVDNFNEHIGYKKGTIAP